MLIINVKCVIFNKAEVPQAPLCYPFSVSHGSPSLLAVSCLAPYPDDKRTSRGNGGEKHGEEEEMNPAEDSRGPR